MPGSTLYGVELMVELAIGQSATAGHWGSGAWAQARWGTSDTSLGDWVDVTCDVLDGVRMTASSNAEVGTARRWESASVAFDMLGSQWDPWNGPHVRIIGDRTPVRISWRSVGESAWQRAFTGFIATKGYQWDPEEQQAKVACVDGTSILVAADAPPQPLQGANETASLRVRRIADYSAWPGGYDITAGGSTLVGTTLDDPAWDELLKVADTDLALMWVKRSGVLAYRPRGRVGVGISLSPLRLTVCPDGINDVQMMTLGRAQPTVTRNRVWISHRKQTDADPDAPVVFQEDRESVARYQPHDFRATDLWHNTDSWSTVVAQQTLVAGAWPSPAPGVVALDSITEDPRVATLLLSVEPDVTFDIVDDNGAIWRESVVGWDITVTHGSIEGVLEVEDVSRWAFLGVWGSTTQTWGVAHWSIGGY